MPLALAGLLCLAQQADPVLAGRVVDAAGKPVAAATVTLLARPIPFDLDPAREHRVVTTTDARGSFRAALRADGVYSVWAATATAATAIAESESAPGFVELRLAPRTEPRTIDVTGLDAWSDAATFRFRALVGGENFDLAPVALRDGSLRLPPLPPLDRRAIEVLRGDDRAVWVGVPTAACPAISLPPPETWTVRVTDDKSTPLQGVDVHAFVSTYLATESDLAADRDRGVWSLQGQTDASGKLTMRVPGQPLLLSHKDGHAASLDGRSGPRAVRAGRFVLVDANAPANHVDVVLRAAPSVAAALVMQDGAPLAVDRLGVKARLMPGTFAFVVPLSDGKAALPSFPADTVFVSAVTTLGPEVRDLLRKRFGFAPPSVFRLPHPTALPDHPPLDAANWHCLHVIHSDGRPAANTRVWLGDSSTTGGKILRTDRAGRLLFEAHRTVRAVVYAAAGYGTIDVPANVTEARLPLRSVRVTAGRTIDADGKPVAGQTVLMYLAGIPDATDELRICAQNVGWRRARSDAEGRFEMVLPPFVARIGLTTDLYRLTPRIDLDWDPEKPPELVLTVPGR